MSDSVLAEFHPFRSADARDRYLAFNDAVARRLWPVAPRDVVVPTSYGSTFVRVSGPDGAPPLVLLPGNRAHSLYWAPMIEPLSRAFRTYAIDAVYDVGRSVPSRQPKSAREMVDWLDEVFDGLGLADGIRLMGFSYGAWLTSEYALHRQDRLAKLVWLSPGGIAVPATQAFILRAMLLAVPSRLTFSSFIHWLMPDALNGTSQARDLFEVGLEDMVLAAKSFAALKFVPGTPRVLSDDELQSIEIPVLYMVGENERLCSAPAALERLEAVVPIVETECYSGAGHDLLFVHPGELALRAVEFLSD